MNLALIRFSYGVAMRLGGDFSDGQILVVWGRYSLALWSSFLDGAQWQDLTEEMPSLNTMDNGGEWEVFFMGPER